MSYTIKKTVDYGFNEAVDKVQEDLKEEGFGVLCDIDVKETFKKKLDIEFRRYRILGACNPGYARTGLAEEIDLGVLLPCNVLVYETDEGDVVVSALDPRTIIDVTENEDLECITDDVYEILDGVVSEL
ncbi:MAG: DUF302 domain-containing protein [Halobacteria archaeon]